MINYKPTNRIYNFEDYNAEWAIWFSKISTVLKEVLGNKIIAIEHVGSTAVPGMKAKPIIDVVVVLNPFEIVTNEEDKLLIHGYFVSKDVIAEDSYLIEKRQGNNKTENIHVFPKGHKEIEKLILARDYLRTHPERVKAYSDLKEKLKKEFPYDYIAYRKGKESFMDETVELAKKWKL